MNPMGVSMVSIIWGDLIFSEGSGKTAGKKLGNLITINVCPERGYMIY